MIFWTITFLAVAAGGLGAILRSPWWFLAGAALIAPFALYLAALPMLRGIGLLLAVPPLLAAILIRAAPRVAQALAGMFALLVLSVGLFFFRMAH